MKDLVLIGGGHSHVAVLKQFGMRPMPGVRVTLISRGVYTPYSGMLPGLIAGHYTFEDAHIDLQRLARFAGARAFFDEATGLDPVRREVHCRSRPAVSYDMVSINIGSTPNVSVPGAADHAIAVKPIDRFLQQWDALRLRIAADDAPRKIAIVGGGAGGVELLLSVQHHLRHLLEGAGRSAARLEYHLFTRTDTLLPTHNRRVRAEFQRLFEQRAVHVHTGAEVVGVAHRQLCDARGATYQVDEILWTTEARAATWIRDAGLTTDEEGFIRVAATLESVSHPNVFAAGDVASIVGHRLAKSGVYAVREGQTLAPNLRRALSGEPLRRYRPQRQFLGLISTGDKYAVASRGPFAFTGRWVWRWKDSIDRAFMRKYSELPSMADAGGLKPAPAEDTPANRRGRLQAAHDDAMRCGGCGAKIGSDILTRALSRVRTRRRDDVIIGLEAPDDAAVVSIPACKAIVHSVDFFRSMVDDPYVFGKIAATHALGDLYAVGAEPQTALAIVTIPPGPESKVEDTLVQLMAGAVEVLDQAGAALVGGHTAEGAELALGFSVNGLVDRDRVIRKGGMRPGDCVVLTKPVGTGTLLAADMRHGAKGAWVAAAIASMMQSNRAAGACMLRHDATACTDVTGFGVAGHLLEMAKASGVSVDLDLRSLPVLEGAEETIAAGIVSSLQPQNLTLRRSVVAHPALADSPRFALLFDPQTSGGLLAAVAAAAAAQCVADLRVAGYTHAAIIGQVTEAVDHIACITCNG